MSRRRPASVWAAGRLGLLALGLLISPLTVAATPTALQSIEPASIDLGESARLTITAIGDEAPSITPPMVPGLEFLAVGQSQRVEIINGVTSAKTTVTYQVIAQQAGVFTIPSALPGGEPVVLTVNRGNGAVPGAAGSSAPAYPGAAGSPQGSSSPPVGSTRQGTNGAAFVRLRLAKHELYVGEMIPVDIQVGARDGMVASLNGPPTLNGDAFTLNKLPENPTRSEEILDGKPYILFTWHTALVAVKPGTLSLTIETPLTVRIQAPGHPGAGFFNGSGFEDLFNDPAFQGFFGRSMQRDITVSSAAETFTVLALPGEGRPADFSGAVGQFSVASGLSQDKAAEGDPITLRMSVSGEGDFERVASPMLHDGDGWKAYTPTSRFKASDDVGYHGDKTFEQPLIATQAGERTVPEVRFSWFDPQARRYVEAHTPPLRVDIVPAAAGGPFAGTQAPGAGTPAPPAGAAAPGAGAEPVWRADHPDDGRGRVASLVPPYVQPAYLAVPPLLLAAFSGVWLWMRQSERPARHARAAPVEPRIDSLATALERHAAAGDARAFFEDARAALRQVLAARWGAEASGVTTEAVLARLGAHSEVSHAFLLADEAAYSRLQISSADFQRWKRIVLRHVERRATA